MPAQQTVTIAFQAPAIGDQVLAVREEGGAPAVVPAVLVAFGSIPEGARKLWDNHWFWLGAAVITIVGGYVFALWLRSDHHAPPIKLGADFTVLAMLYVIAQAIERLIEPFTNLILPTTGDSEDAESASASAIEKLASGNIDGAKADLQQAANKQAKVDELRKWRALFFWAIASALAFGICAYLGVYLIRSIIDLANGAQPPSERLDLFVTGMAVGGGTKPLHDLISNIQKTKETNASPETASTGR